MKRLLTSILAGVIVFGLVAAFAATLTVNSDGLGAGSTTVGNCDADETVAVGYTTAWDATDSQYEITEIVVSGIDANCTSVGAVVATQDLGTVTPTAGSATLSLTTPLAVETFAGAVDVVVSS